MKNADVLNVLFLNTAGSAGTVLDITIHYATERKPYTYDYGDIYSHVKEVPEFGVIICGNNRCL